MPSPSAPIRLIYFCFIERATRISLQRTHHFFRRAVGSNDRVDMVRPDVSGNQAPSPALARLPDASEYIIPSDRVQLIGLLGHQALALRFEPAIRTHGGSAWRVVLPVDRSLLTG